MANATSRNRLSLLQDASAPITGRIRRVLSRKQGTPFLSCTAPAPEPPAPLAPPSPRVLPPLSARTFGEIWTRRGGNFRGFYFRGRTFPSLLHSRFWVAFSVLRLSEGGFVPRIFGGLCFRLISANRGFWSWNRCGCELSFGTSGIPWALFYGHCERGKGTQFPWECLNLNVS